MHPPGEKEGFTVGLAVSADGRKYPALIVFKGNQKTGVLSNKIMQKLNAPDNVQIKSTKSAWWNEELDLQWIDLCFPTGEERKVLIRDQATQHKTDSSKTLLEERNVLQIFIPVGMTGQLQPLDVGVNKPFKQFYRDEYHAWRTKNNSKTKKGYLKQPSRQDFINFVSVAWDKITVDCIRNSFLKSGITDENSVV